MDSESELVEILIKFEDQFLQAERDADVEFLEARLSNDFMAIGPMGFVLDKSGWIGRFSSGDFAIVSLDSAEVATRIYAMVGIVTSVQTSIGTYKGNEVRMKVRCTHVTLWDGKEWKLAHVQMSPIQDARPPNTPQKILHRTEGDA